MNPSTETLPDGTRVLIRLCRSEEDHCGKDCVKAGISTALKRTSERTRQLRFAGGVNTLSDSQLDYLATLDNRDRLAWCAHEAGDDMTTGAGIARYVRLPDEPDIAEFAITIVDAYQGQGLGAILLGRLIESARENGIRILRGYVLPGNSAMIRLGKRFDAQIEHEDSALRVDIAIGE
jgi:RimJ/RimL family protein N-acetyltransferase